MSDGPYFTVPARSSSVPCKGCGKRVYWIKTERGKNMQVDCHANERCFLPTDQGPGSGLSHFATCPKADQFRRRK